MLKWILDDDLTKLAPSGAKLCGFAMAEKQRAFWRAKRPIDASAMALRMLYEPRFSGLSPAFRRMGSSNIGPDSAAVGRHPRRSAATRAPGGSKCLATPPWH